MLIATKFLSSLEDKALFSKWRSHACQPVLYFQGTDLLQLIIFSRSFLKKGKKGGVAISSASFVCLFGFGIKSNSISYKHAMQRCPRPSENLKRLLPTFGKTQEPWRKLDFYFVGAAETAQPGKSHKVETPLQEENWPSTMVYFSHHHPCCHHQSQRLILSSVVMLLCLQIYIIKAVLFS